MNTRSMSTKDKQAYQQIKEELTKEYDELTESIEFNMPQRWSGSHFYQAVLNGEEHVSKVTFLTTEKKIS